MERFGDVETEQIEGQHAVRVALEAKRRRIHELLVTDEASGLAELAHDLGIPVKHVDTPYLRVQAQSHVPQGVIAIADPLPRVELKELLVKGAFVVALDGVTDPQNVGAIARSVEIFGGTGLVIPRRRAATITTSVTKAAAGALEYLRLCEVSGIAAAMDQAKRADVWTVVLDDSGNESLDDLRIADQPLFLIIGAEGEGASELVKKRADVITRIPMHGKTESLNASAAAAIACYEIARLRVGNPG